MKGEVATPCMSPPSRDPKKVVLLNGASSLVTILLRISVLVWVNQYLIRRISPEEYGLFPLVSSLVVFADFFKNIFTGGLGRYIVEEDARGNNEGVCKVVSSMFPFLVGASLLIGLVAGAAIWKIDYLLDIAVGQVADARMMFGLLIVMLLVGMVSGPFTIGPYVKQRFFMINGVSLAEEALRITILLCLLFGVSTRVMWLVVASVIAGLVRTGVLWGMTRRMLPAVAVKWRLTSISTARRMMEFGAWTSVQGLTNLMSNTVPFLLLNRFGSAVDVSSFHLGRLPDVQFRRLALAAITPVQPALTCTFATAGEGAMQESYIRGGRYHLWLTLIGIAPFLVFAKPIGTLYAGERYHGVGLVMIATLGCYPAIWASAMFYRVAHAIGRVRKYYVCDIAVQGVALLAMYSVVAWLGWGAAGAAMAMSLTLILMHFVLIWPMGLRLVGGTWSRFIRSTVLPGMAPFVVAILLCVGFGGLVSVNNWWLLGAATAVAVTGYLATLFGLCLDESDRAFLASVGTSLRKRAKGFKSSKVRAATPANLT
jgi:O-antigen/teichoic acid export membrane protein